MTKASVTAQLNKILNEIEGEVAEKADRAASRAAEDAAERLRTTSPQRTGDYAGGWKVKNKSGKKFSHIVHNATDYQLTHLLEKSHVIRNASGSYGRTSPGHGQVVHIKPVEIWAKKEYLQAVKQALSNL